MHRRTVPKQVRKYIQEYVNVLKRDHLPIYKVLLFGSYAKGTPHRWSDVDLCVISSRFKDPWEATQYLWSKRVRDTGITIEPVGFTKKDFQKRSPLTEEIQKIGIEFPI